MSVNFIMSSLFVVSEAIQRLLKLADGNLEMVLRCFQRIIDDPAYRQQVWFSMMVGRLVPIEITKEDWTLREARAMAQLGLLEFDGDSSSDIELEIRKAANRGGFGINHYFVPAGLTRTKLIELAYRVGMKVNNHPDCDGQELPTKAGVLDCDLSAIMTSTNADHQPFLLNYDEHEVWAKAQGGEGLTSAEETLYLIIRHCMTFGRVLFMGGWLRCRNTRGDGEQLIVCFNAGYGMGIRWCHRSARNWRIGAIDRKFTPLVA
jgi:hypothetical protein